MLLVYSFLASVLLLVVSLSVSLCHVVQCPVVEFRLFFISPSLIFSYYFQNWMTVRVQGQDADAPRRSPVDIQGFLHVLTHT